MNKYELALVVSANVDEEVRNATVETGERINHSFRRYNY